MEDVRLYDFDFHLLHIEHDIFSANWRIFENEPGTFELHFPLESPLSQVLQSAPYLVAVQGNKQAIVTGYQLSREGVLYGKGLSWLLSRFCLPTDFEKTGEAQALCRELFQLILEDIPQIVFEENTEADFGQVSLSGQAGDSLLSLVENAMEQSGGGHQLLFQPREGRFCFSLTKGRELPLVLSEDNKNAYDMELSHDSSPSFFGGYYSQKVEHKGTWDPTQNEPSLTDYNPDNYATGYRINLPSDYDSYKRFGITWQDGDYMRCRDKSGTWEKVEELSDFPVHIPGEKTGIYAWETRLSGATEEEAKADLKTLVPEEEVRLTTHELRLGRDYELGDRVKLRLEKGSLRLCFSRKITGVHIWFEAGEQGEQPVFSRGDQQRN